MSSVADPVSSKEYFLPGEAAVFLQCSPESVSNCYDKGKLKGDRNGPRKCRRITRESLIALMTERGIPLGELAPEGSSDAPQNGDPSAQGAPPPGDGVGVAADQ